MNKQQIVSVLAELHKISGFRVSLHDTDYSEIAAYPAGRCSLCSLIHTAEGEYDACVACDKAACKKALELSKTYIYECRHGLTEAVSPLYNFGTLTGYLMMGQVADENTDLDSLRSILFDISHDFSRINEIVESTPEVKSERISSFVNIMTICAEYMTLTNAIPGLKPSTAELAKLFVYEHYHEKISISDICDALGKSKSAICPAFREKYGTTLTSYLNDLRIDEAAKLLLHSDLSVGEIADRVGYYDQSYFTKVFTKKMGLTPTQFKKRDI